MGGDVSWNMALECRALPKLTGGEEVGRGRGRTRTEKVVVAAPGVKVECGPKSVGLKVHMKYRT